MAKKKARKDPAYLREQGKRKAYVEQERRITFCFTKLDKTQGQTIQEWEDLGLLSSLLERTQTVGQMSTRKAYSSQSIKLYTKVDFPPNSKLKKPNHIPDVIYSSMHITPNSQEVIVGYVENDVFHIVFLDKDHHFWPSILKNT